MPLLTAIIGILLLVILVGYFKINAFISFILVAMGIGFASGLSTSAITNAIKQGIGDTLGFLLIILGFGAMLGKLVASSGAAQKISDQLIKTFPNRFVQWAVMLTGFIVGIPMFYSVGFVILLPLVFMVANSSKLPLLYVGMPMLAALSVTHGYLPPHPAPTALVESYGADLGTTLIYGLLVAIPAIMVGGPLFASTLKKYKPDPLKSLINENRIPDDDLPSLGTSLFTALLPVIILGGSALLKMIVTPESIIYQLAEFLGDPIMAMAITIVVALYTLGIARGKKMAFLSNLMLEAIKDIAMILLIIGGAGALKQVLVASEISDYIGLLLHQLPISPLILAWGMAAMIRVCVGSATVAGLTSAGLVAPLIPITGANPSLMVLATGAGSLMFSHVNDAGFWMFKEYFNMSISDTFKTWTVMETIVSSVGIIGIIVLNQIIN